MLNNMKAALHNLGCRVNAYETEAMTKNLAEAGFEIVPFEAEADIYIVNTCTVTQIADRKSRQMLHRAKERNPEALVVACGCYVEDGREKLEADTRVDLLLGNEEKGRIAEILKAHFAACGESCGRQEETEAQGASEMRMSEYEDKSPSEALQTGRRARAFIKIEDGCNQFCSYCMIPYVRGRVRSRGAEEILREIREAADAGTKEIILSGIHISSFGSDTYRPGVTNAALLELLEEAAGIPGIERLRLGSLEPGVVTEEFAGRLSAISAFCPSFHLSLQSGNDNVLLRMRRSYDTAAYRRALGILRDAFEDPGITTDIICGFPGETDEEFADTLRFAEECAFAGIHVFKYSRREGTKAAAMSGQIPDRIKQERSAELLGLAKELKAAYAGRRVCGDVSVLFEEEADRPALAAAGLADTSDGRRWYRGHSREGIVCHLSSGQELSGRILDGSVEMLLLDGSLLLKG